MGEWDVWVGRELDSVRATGQWREVRDFDARGPGGSLEGTQPPLRSGTQPPAVSFAGNDYLGLSTHSAVVAAAHEAVERWGTGAGASRLVTGSRPVHSELERALAEWKGEEAALLFPSGYAANLGVLATFGWAGARILSDERNHASIVDGCRLARADVAVWRHRDLDHLAALLGGDPRPAIVVTDTVFSMDGDVAPVAEIAELCRRHRALLVVDEAHAVLGPDPDMADVQRLRVGTLSKALGSAGGFVAGSRAAIALLVNRARPAIYSTAMPPATAAAALAALGVVRSAEGDDLRARLRRFVHRVALGHPTPIVAVVLGTDERAVAASAVLLQRGLFVPAIRPPTVAPGTSRLRVTLSAAHTDAQVDALVAALAALAPAIGSRVP